MTIPQSLEGHNLPEAEHTRLVTLCKFSMLTWGLTKYWRHIYIPLFPSTSSEELTSPLFYTTSSAITCRLTIYQSLITVNAITYEEWGLHILYLFWKINNNSYISWSSLYNERRRRHVAQSAHICNVHSRTSKHVCQIFQVALVLNVSICLNIIFFLQVDEFLLKFLTVLEIDA